MATLEVRLARSDSLIILTDRTTIAAALHTQEKLAVRERNSSRLGAVGLPLVGLPLRNYASSPFPKLFTVLRASLAGIEPGGFSQRQLLKQIRPHTQARQADLANSQG